ncbi:CvpA family protein [Candidatus Nitrosacidococcus tergens]|uniref:Colicin V production protein n=1 Tax=Candidatus Nitrosacidococcus tergens TaxID=553981 RepID=A0A7G1Q9G7_9GAMM|nr:CvpA family protein [Candidatus Nitrosacidococcus tergens]CAB1275947.1 Colicin V production protein [Candidatus Nitrosacidococcus tergens]
MVNHFIWIDYLITGIILISSFIGFSRGFVKEFLSLISWGVGFLVAWRFSSQITYLVDEILPSIPPSFQTVIAFFLLLITVLLLSTIVSVLLGFLIKEMGLTNIDRILGIFFGAIRGVAIIVILIALSDITLLSQETWWKHSQLLGYFQGFALQIKSYIPMDILN